MSDKCDQLETEKHNLSKGIPILYAYSIYYAPTYVCMCVVVCKTNMTFIVKMRTLELSFALILTCGNNYWTGYSLTSYVAYVVCQGVGLTTLTYDTILYVEHACKATP